MRILALDSSGLVATVAILEDDQTVAEYTVNYKKTHSQTLLPMLDEIVKMTEFDLSTIDAIAVSGGPGSFTGLRIGAATAKGLGLALDKPLIHIPTVDGLAYNLYGCRHNCYRQWFILINGHRPTANIHEKDSACRRSEIFQVFGWQSGA